jgi:cell division protein FtsQ
MKKNMKPILPLSLRLRNFLIVFAFAAISVLIAVWFLVSCRVETVLVENAVAVPQPTILDAANVKAGRHLYSVGEAQIERRITASSPYVKSVTLKRKLPSTLRILIEEYDLSYYIEYEGRYYLLTHELLVLEETTPENALAKGAVPLLLTKLKEPKVSKDDTNAPKVLTPMQTLEFQDKTDLALSQRLLLALANSDFAEEITAVDLSDHFNLQVQISDKYTVLLGNEKDFEKKISRTEHALDYLSESMYALTGILHAEKDVPVTFEFTGTIG